MSVKQELELMKEQVKKLIYATEHAAIVIRDLQAEMSIQNMTVLRQLQDTKATLDYVKSYIGIDDFFDECYRQGKSSRNGRIE